MPRDVPIGNGSMLVTFDGRYQLRDIYFPYVGAENHNPGDICHTGIWVAGAFSWFSDDSWQRTIEYAADSIVTKVTLEHEELELRVICTDAVDFDRNILFRRVAVTNLASEPREIRMFFHYDLHIEGNDIGDTFAYHPNISALIAYKRRRYFLMNGQIGDEAGHHIGISSWATGLKEVNGLEGTWRDAEDGELGRNPIAQGSVDGTIALHAPDVAAGEEVVFHHWLALAETWPDVRGLDELVRERGPSRFIERTADYWRLWINKEHIDGADLDERFIREYKRSLLVMRTQIDSRGAIIAANDTDILRFSRDTYSYMWPRDGALAACALIKAGYQAPCANFFNFCANAFTDGGYLLHKYNPDGSLASSWHPWMDKAGNEQLPIQEDETALVLYALWEHYKRYREVEFIRPLYRRIVTTAGDFMCRYRDPATKLPLPSYDLWEERHGIHAFTLGAVWAGLRAAANFTKLFGENRRSDMYNAVADEIKQAAIRYAWAPDLNRFLRTINVGDDGAIIRDETVDSSLFGLWYFEMFSPDEPRIVSTINAVRERLWLKTDVGGCARYERDRYQRWQDVPASVPGNPWFICTLWLAQYAIATAKTLEDLSAAKMPMRWACDHALHSGVLAEQAHPFTGVPLSVSPLTWSHATYCLTFAEYVRRWTDLQQPAKGSADLSLSVE
ncbi:MAG: glycoside hydrolase family 15 protein [Candidatus Eremiobacter antarcticus]|nr:glycoside hydrolase family 15 protein [Candidatus Eremiobacteraeota bacterium]MBC5807866.1 glycoside hydrolase family 15 protein [Candidatus Eremiobacteraeota bacterium]PZR62763.1 MAG: glycoside hydrolase family 15 protein [Candidatus Eremiobacter sp. RRmetagenome_bin22]